MKGNTKIGLRDDDNNNNKRGVGNNTVQISLGKQ